LQNPVLQAECSVFRFQVSGSISLNHSELRVS
jgi:hypothetical protein